MDSIKFIGEVRSSLKDIKDCPLQEFEDAPEATIEIEKKYREAMTGLKRGSKVIVLTWLHKGNRKTLTTHPRNDPKATIKGVFATRSNDRPNPIGLHETEILSVKENGEIKVSHLEVLDGTPIIDIKIALNG